MTETILITKVEEGWIGGIAKGFLRHTGQLAGADSLAIFDAPVLRDAKRCCDAQIPVRITMGSSGTRSYVVRITADHPPSYIVASVYGFLELNPYYQRWFWTSTPRFATPLTVVDADALIARVRVGDLDDAQRDPSVHILSDETNRTPQVVPVSEANAAGGQIASVARSAGGLSPR